MKKLRWPLLIVLLAITTIGVLLMSRQQVLPPVVPEEVKPVTGGAYSEALIGSFNRLNPLLALNSSPDHDIDRLLFSSLVSFDDHGLPKGDLADSWGISQDGLVYNFALNPDATWHDGEPVTSDDVIFTIDLMKDENSVVPSDVRSLWKIVEVNRLDDKALQFRLPEPFAPFLDYLTFGILPKHLLEGQSFDDLVKAKFNLEPVGSGPFRFDHLLVENGTIQGVVLQAYDRYFGQRPFIDQFIFRYYPDSASALAAYKNGEVMGISRVSEDVLPDVLKENGLNLYTGRLPQLSIIFLNLDNPDTPFFQDSAVRNALMTGLNRQAMIDHILDGQGIIADGPVFPNTWAYYDGLDRIDFDPTKAAEMIKEAGYTVPTEGDNVRVNEDGVKLAFTLAYPDDPQHETLAESIQKDWTKLGIQVDLEPVDYETLVSDYMETRQYQAALIDLNMARSPDPDPYPFWHEAQITGGQNYSKWNDRQASEYLEQARITRDITERAKDYQNFQVRFSQELPALPLFYPVYSYAVSSEVQGVQMGPLFDSSDRFSTVTSWFLNSKRQVAAASTPPATAAPEN